MERENKIEQKILDIFKKENRKLGVIEIIKSLKNEYTAEDIRDLIEQLTYMCKEGILKSSSGNTYSINELLKGKVDLHEKGNAHIIVPGHLDIFIPRNMLKGACDKDTVLVDITDVNKNEGKVVKVIDRSLGKSIAEVINNNGTLEYKLLDEDMKYNVIVDDNNLNLVDGQIVHLSYVKDLYKNQVLAKVDYIIGHKNAPLKETQIAMIASEFDLKLDFDEETKQEALQMPRALTKEMIDEELSNGRVDFRNEVIFTIDGKDTKDIDDAVGIKMLKNGNYELGVHIADVSHYVKKGSALWNEAEQRGNSNYLGNKVLPMLPVELSNGICSLNPNEDRFTISCIMEINHKGEVLNSKIVKGIINSRKKMNYDAVEDIIQNRETIDTKDYTTLEYIIKDGQDIDNISFLFNISKDELLSYNEKSNFTAGSTINIPCKNIIKNMNALSKILRSAKERRGEIEFISDEVKIIMDENDKVVDIEPRIQREAEKLIEDFMIVANESVANYVNDMSLPFVYRVHETPSEKKIDEYLKFLALLGIHYPGKLTIENVSSQEIKRLMDYLKDKENYKMLNKKMLRSMQKARYFTENLGHFGIASPCYTHFTSPIRRMSDLLVHTSLTEYIKNENLEHKFLEKWLGYLEYVCDHISKCERNSEKCEYAVDDMLKAEYMMDHIDEEFEATIESLLNSSFFVQTDKFIDGRVDVVIKDDKTVPLTSICVYNEKLMAFTKGSEIFVRYGDRVLVKCLKADPQRREVDFALVRKL